MITFAGVEVDLMVWSSVTSLQSYLHTRGENCTMWWFWLFMLILDLSLLPPLAICMDHYSLFCQVLSPRLHQCKRRQSQIDENKVHLVAAAIGWNIRIWLVSGIITSLDLLFGFLEEKRVNSWTTCQSFNQWFDKNVTQSLNF